MKSHNIKIKYTELALLIFVWTVILITPVLFREDNNRPVWRSLFNQFEIIIPLTFLFLVNRFILVPKLLFKGKPLLFITAVFGIIVFFMGAIFIYATKVREPHIQMTLQDKNPDQKVRGWIPQAFDRFGKPLPPIREQPRPIPTYANFLILSVLVVGFDTGLKSGIRWMDTENEKIKLEKENVATQLVLLRNQISPHFFMNTLNNIHSLVDINAEEAKEAIIKLSKMMRYLLYETETEMTTLLKEIEFLESYINLMRLRFSEKVNITFHLPSAIPDKKIPPFLFTSIIENAFKHGISYKKESFIDVDIIFGENRLILIVKNSKQLDYQHKEFSGIGIENTRKRLNLLYGNSYHLDIIENETQFTVNLSIPL